MPRQTTDRLVGYGLQIIHGDQPVADPADGQPIFDARGNQFVCEFGNSRITILDAHDRPIEVVGGPGSAPGLASP